MHPATSSRAVNRILLVIAFFGVILFAFGFHAVDNGYNMQKLEHLTGTTFLDSNLYGQLKSADEVYRSGLWLLLSGFSLVSFSLLLFDSNFSAKK